MTSTEAVETDVVVIGGGIAGLVAAREAARGGAQVVVFEAAGAPGGLVGAHRVGSLVLDAGAESFATRGGVVMSLLEELGLGADIVTPARVPARVHVDGVSLPMPATGVLGIPTDLQAPGLQAVLGTEGLERATADLQLPAEVGSEETSLAGLVRARMGEAVLERLLRPVVRGVHSVEPEEIGAEDLLPGLRARLASAGSLAGALAGFRAAAPAGSAVQGIEGGMHLLVEALLTDLRATGVDLRLGAPCLRARPDGDAWLLEFGAGHLGGALPLMRVTARRLLLACAPHTWTFLAEGGAGGAARGNSAFAEQGARWPAPSGVDLLTLTLDDRPLPEHDRGGVLVADPGQGAKALTYLSSKWAWLGRLAGGDQVVLRLSYAAGVLPGGATARPGDIGAPSATGAPGAVGTEGPPGMDRGMSHAAPTGAPSAVGTEHPAGIDHGISHSAPATADQIQFARRDAGRLLGLDIPAQAVRNHAVIRHTLPRPILATGMAERVRLMRASVAAAGNLEVAGTWIAGTGLASVIPDARAAGARIVAI